MIFSMNKKKYIRYIKKSENILNGYSNFNNNSKFFKESIFSALNEKLEQKRAFGVEGEPLPGRFLYKREYIFSQSKAISILSSVKKEVLSDSAFLCGLIIEKDAPETLNQFGLNDDLVDRLKEERL